MKKACLSLMSLVLAVSMILTMGGCASAEKLLSKAERLYMTGEYAEAYAAYVEYFNKALRTKNYVISEESYANYVDVCLRQEYWAEAQVITAKYIDVYPNGNALDEIYFHSEDDDGGYAVLSAIYLRCIRVPQPDRALEIAEKGIQIFGYTEHLLDALHDVWAQSPISFAEPALEKLVRNHLDRPNGDIVPEDLDDITRIALYNGNETVDAEHYSIDENSVKNSIAGNFDSISSAEDFKYFRNLETLIMSDGQIKDFSSLVFLPKMKWLQLANNQIENTDFLRHLPNLEYLAIEFDQITSFSEHYDLPKLQTLILCCNKITDISGIHNYRELTHLNVEKNQITDISSLDNMPKLQELIVSFNQITDISPILRFKDTLTFVLVGGNKIKDKSPLEELRSDCVIY